MKSVIDTSSLCLAPERHKLHARAVGGVILTGSAFVGALPELAGAVGRKEPYILLRIEAKSRIIAGVERLFVVSAHEADRPFDTVADGMSAKNDRNAAQRFIARKDKDVIVFGTLEADACPALVRCNRYGIIVSECACSKSEYRSLVSKKILFGLSVANGKECDSFVAERKRTKHFACGDAYESVCLHFLALLKFNRFSR